MDVLQIKCPWCSAVLSVKNQPGLERAMLTCPVCSRKQPFTSYKKHEPKKAPSPNTKYPGMDDSETNINLGGMGGMQASNNTASMIIGQLTVDGTSIKFPLSEGMNVIGRQAASSKASIQIPTGSNQHLSREHLVIEVKKVPMKGMVHYISLYKEKVNPTKVGNQDLMYGDKIILNNGDIISLPDVKLRFEIPDEDSTKIL